MTGIPAAQLLVDFDLVEGQAEAPLQRNFEPLSSRRAADLAAARDEGYEAGLMEGRLAGLGEIDERLQRQAQDHDRDLAAARKAWTQEQSGVLATQIMEALRVLETRVASLTAEALKPVLETALRAHVIGKFSTVIRRSLAGADETLLEVTGPSDLLQLLREELADVAGAVSFRTEVNDCEVRATVGHKTIETNLAIWSKMILEAAQ